ncbi:MAG: DNA mismatch repair endonuclease MutL [Oscillospiraceae bacterium]|nr:DNA mismatch repair endonuclease MutL [Oscillospiraceae bacterium]MDD4369233.1 DNA mismatch repair endonuclease MutL [Oscillospiraceae bacterium]
MALIHKLDPQTYNSIAAGEVVERPASVVKELCENALDAGADTISVAISGGGIRSILISDNGCGMDREDALNAFEAHATSKLSHISDLDGLATMGFRGEALASVAAVSRVKLETCPQGSEDGTRVVIEGGELQEHVPCGTSGGTRIQVEDLFYNTPARYKFLKKDSTEASRVNDVVLRLAMARPDVSFRFSSDGKLKLHTPGNDDLMSAAYSLFGAELAGQLVNIQPLAEERDHYVAVRGLLGRPTLARRSRSLQYFFVNGRSIQSALLTKALEEAYRSLLMKGEYPFAILLLTVPGHLVDVNVHPQKMELRFWNDSQVFSAVLHAVRNTLFENLAAADALSLAAPLAPPQPEESATGSGRLQDQAAAAPTAAPAARPAAPAADWQFPTADQAETSSQQSLAWPVGQMTPPVLPQPGETQPQPPAAGSQDGPRLPMAKGSHLPKSATQGSLPLAEAMPAPTAQPNPAGAATGTPLHPDLQYLLQARYVGQLFDTYLIFEDTGRVTLIDQHAAHEKILFEKLWATRQQSVRSQVLLTPQLLKPDPSELSVLETEKPFLQRLGFDYDLFGQDSISLRGIPAIDGLTDGAGALLAAVDEIIANGANLELVADRDRLYLNYATRACKAAVKGHDHLAEPEIRALLRQLLELQHPYQCPHGRPVFFQFPERELEKRFRRIV